MRQVLSFDDVMLVPRYSEVVSRSLVDPSVILKTFSKRRVKLKIPIVSSPMDTVSESEMIFRLWRLGALGIFHRYNTIEQQNALVSKSLELHANLIQTCSDDEAAEISHEQPDFLWGFAVGVTGDYIERAYELSKRNPAVICIDVAHGHHKNVVNALEKLHKNVDLSTIHIMAGNVGPADGFLYLAGTKLLNSIRCGLSGGSICSTYMATGFGYPTLQSVLDANHAKQRNELFDVQIVADGGIRGQKDVNISIAAGADVAMLGSVLAGTKATPGQRIIQDGREWKQYRGGASYEAQKARGIEKPRVEGVSALVPYKGKLENVVNPIYDGLQSGLSYVGAMTIEEFRGKVELVQLTNAGYVQGTPHILRGK